MITYLYCSRNKKSGQFGKINCEIYTKDQIAQLYAASVKEASDDHKVYLRELEVYCLGSLDTETGDIKPERTFILDVATLLPGGVNDVGKEESVKQSV